MRVRVIYTDDNSEIEVTKDAEDRYSFGGHSLSNKEALIDAAANAVKRALR